SAARLAFGRYYTPDCFFVAGNSELIPSLSEKKSFGEPIIYICREKSCTSPFKNVEDAMNYIKEARYKKHANH
ncbi:MAG: hypothetical protein RMJ53_08355, partial [Chitinophagales bacterium]|nr:hypothetical protein [Chitinophagales bacterium]